MFDLAVPNFTENSLLIDLIKKLSGQADPTQPKPTAKVSPSPSTAPAKVSGIKQTELSQDPVAHVDITDQTPIAEATAPEQAPAPMPMQAAPEQGILQQAAQQSPGILNILGGGDVGSFMKKLSMGLMAAGSSDPAATLTNLKKAQVEEELSKKPKVVPVANGAAALLVYPDGRTELKTYDEVQKLLKDQSEGKFEQSLIKAIVGARAGAEAAGLKEDQKKGAEARSSLSSTEALYDGWKKAKQVVDQQASDSPIMSKIQGAFPGVSGFFGGDQVATNKFLQSLAVDETLLNTARTKGAISDREMELFKSPIPSLSDDRERVWKPYIEQRLPIIEKLIKFQTAEAARGDRGSGSITGGGLVKPSETATPSMKVPGLSDKASKYFK